MITPAAIMLFDTQADATVEARVLRDDGFDVAILGPVERTTITQSVGGQSGDLQLDENAAKFIVVASNRHTE